VGRFAFGRHQNRTWITALAALCGLVLFAGTSTASEDPVVAISANGPGRFSTTITHDDVDELIDTTYTLMDQGPPWDATYTIIHDVEAGDGLNVSVVVKHNKPGKDGHPVDGKTWTYSFPPFVATGKDGSYPFVEKAKFELHAPKHKDKYIARRTVEVDTGQITSYVVRVDGAHIKGSVPALSVGSLVLMSLLLSVAGLVAIRSRSKPRAAC
jgi:hypothetical protein